MKKYSQILFLALVVCALFLNLNCKKDECATCPPPVEPDSTSHFYTWQIDTIGTWMSYARAAWGTDANNVYVVGSFYSPNYNPDSVTQGTSIIHWDGNQWKPTPFWVGDLDCIYGFSENNIWVAGSNGIAIIGHWDGLSWKETQIQSVVQINGLWGTSSSNLYAVGDAGTILHYNGVSWDPMISGTSLFLSDIWGYDSKTIYASGYNNTTGTGVLLFFDGSQWIKLYERNYTTPIEPYGSTSTVWGYDTSHIYISTGYGSYLGNRFEWQKLNDIPAPVWIEAIRGESYKNIFFVGDFGLVVHWNGKSWHRYDQFYTYAQGGGDNLYGVWAKGNSVFVVGFSSTAQGIIYRGTQ